MDIINRLESYKIKIMKYDGIEDDGGLITQRSEAGVEFNIRRWETHVFTLMLQFLEYEEALEIVKLLSENKEQGRFVNISKNTITEKGYLDFKKVPGEPFFFYELKDVKPSHTTGTNNYSINIKLKERVDRI